MNNKGVTLIELLIVIVVLGIISAFAIPAVGTIITNTEKDAIVADALAIENAAKLYCAQTTCASDEGLDWDELSPYVSSFNDSYYEETDTGDSAVIAQLGSGDWTVTLEKNGAGTAATDEWEWLAAIPSSEQIAGTARGHVSDD
jgi:type IV pilus assembly protein PilA